MDNREYLWRLIESTLGYQFTVVMLNLNYDVLQDVPQDKLDVQIIDLH